MKKPVVLAAGLALVVVIASPASAAPKPALDRDVELTNYETAAVVAGDSVWIALNWQGGGGDASGFRLVVKKADGGVEVGYPANTATYTSLWADDTLSDGELDFTAIKLTLPYQAGSDVKLSLTLTYDHSGRQKRRDFLVKVPVVAYQGGQDLQQMTDSLGQVTTGESAWVGVSYAGLAPRLDGFQLEVTDSGGLPVVYPANGPATSLHHDARLDDGETDVARFRVDAYEVIPGTYTLHVRATYQRDTTPGELTGSVQLVVAPATG